MSPFWLIVAHRCAWAKEGAQGLREGMCDSPHLPSGTASHTGTLLRSSSGHGGVLLHLGHQVINCQTRQGKSSVNNCHPNMHIQLKSGWLMAAGFCSVHPVLTEPLPGVSSNHHSLSIGLWPGPGEEMPRSPPWDKALYGPTSSQQWARGLLLLTPTLAAQPWGTSVPQTHLPLATCGRTTTKQLSDLHLPITPHAAVCSAFPFHGFFSPLTNWKSAQVMLLFQCLISWSAALPAAGGWNQPQGPFQPELLLWLWKTTLWALTSCPPSLSAQHQTESPTCLKLFQKWKNKTCYRETKPSKQSVWVQGWTRNVHDFLFPPAHWCWHELRVFFFPSDKSNTISWEVQRK